MTDLVLSAPPGVLARPSDPLADAVRAKILADLGQVQTGRQGQRREYTSRAELLAEALTPDTWVMAMDWLSSTRRGSVNTKRAYCDDLRRVWAGYAQELGHDRFALGCFTPDDIRAWRIREEGAGTSPATIGRRLNVLSSFHRYAAERIDLPRNPVTQDDRPQADKGNTATSTPVLSVAEIEAVGRAAGDGRDLLVVSLLYVLAGRVTEVCAADVEDRIDTGRRCEMRITRKGGKQRKVPLPVDVAELLDAHVGERTTGPLLLDAAGNRLDRFDVDRMLTRLGRRAGVLPGRDLTPHVLRASRITHLLDAGVPLAEVQQFADHDNPATTVGYWNRRDKEERTVKLVDQGAEVFDGLADRWLRPAVA